MSSASDDVRAALALARPGPPCCFVPACACWPCCACWREPCGVGAAQGCSPSLHAPTPPPPTHPPTHPPARLPSLQEFYECESGSLGGGHSRGASVDLTGFSTALQLEHKPPGAATAAGGAGGAAGAPGDARTMRRSGSKTSLPAPDSSASSPARTPLAGAIAPQVVADAVAAASRLPGWLAKEGPPPKRRDRLPPPQQQEKSVRCGAAWWGWGGRRPRSSWDVRGRCAALSLLRRRSTSPPPSPIHPTLITPSACSLWSLVKDMVAGVPPTSHLHTLPRPAPSSHHTLHSLWSLIKDMVGKDLTRVCLPVYFNEPLSALQARGPGGGVQQQPGCSVLPQETQPWSTLGAHSLTPSLPLQRHTPAGSGRRRRT